jgi:hypothetical protein
MSLQTPIKIRIFQRKLYCKAKADRRHKVQTRGSRRFPPAEVFGPLGVVRLRDLHLGPLPRALR